MTFLMALHLIGLSVMLWSSSPSLATPLPFNISLEGSAEGEELGSLIPTPSPPATSGPASESPTTSDGSTHVEPFLLSLMVHFLQENMLLILVASILFITIFLILCCACIMSRKRKVNAYYPSSFPSKMYVDQRDKTGGTKLFNEVPEKPSNGQQAEPMDSSKQLQQDIMRAAKNLRTPSKPPLGEREGNNPTQIAAAAEKSPEVNVQAEGEIIEKDNEPSIPPEQSEEEVCQLSDSEAQHCSCPKQPEILPGHIGLTEDDESLTRAALPSGPGHSQAQQEGDSQEDSTVTQSIPLITGEKTAF
ncbi:transmembrane protein 119b [Coregonus clupeaformis]|uniref:transmembrane protein 119b n=1 Tax=Coregonus clupeaformis TaxID=59861 RepID=UPI001BE05034|nr:transmembrane protein 119b [Coregonus clupeaformis]